MAPDRQGGVKVPSSLPTTTSRRAKPLDRWLVLLTRAVQPVLGGIQQASPLQIMEYVADELYLAVWTIKSHRRVAVCLLVCGVEFS